MTKNALQTTFADQEASVRRLIGSAAALAGHKEKAVRRIASSLVTSLSETISTLDDNIDDYAAEEEDESDSEEADPFDD